MQSWEILSEKLAQLVDGFVSIGEMRAAASVGVLAALAAIITFLMSLFNKGDSGTSSFQIDLMPLAERLSRQSERVGKLKAILNQKNSTIKEINKKLQEYIDNPSYSNQSIANGSDKSHFSSLSFDAQIPGVGLSLRDVCIQAGFIKNKKDWQEFSQNDFKYSSLRYHHSYPKGKISVTTSKPMENAMHFSTAYSPGVVVPVLAITNNRNLIYELTSKGNTIAIVSNGTAAMGLGNVGAASVKPILEGKAALFKRFGRINTIDLCVDTDDISEFVQSIKYLEPSFGAICLEDIKAPDCFLIEKSLGEQMEIPIYHDDAHSSAIAMTAVLVNAFKITGRDIATSKIVFNGAGPGSFSALNLLLALGASRKNITLVDSWGVVYTGRYKKMNAWKELYASDTTARTLAEAICEADAFVGLSIPGALSGKMLATMKERPIVLALSSPVPEILPEHAIKVRSDTIIATGRSDYPNQISNLLVYPGIFRGILDVRARKVNIEMKLAAVKALSQLATEPLPEATGKFCNFGANHLIPGCFDQRVLSRVATAVAAAAIETGMARQEIADLNVYAEALLGGSIPD